MAASKKETFSNFIHLSVGVVQAATDMIEQIGRLKGIRQMSHTATHEPWQMEDLREAIQKASRVLANYDACMSAGLEQTTGDVFRTAADKAEAA